MNQTGPKLPVSNDWQGSAIVTTNANRLILLGNQRNLFELNTKAMEWKEIKLPVKKLRSEYKAFEVSKEQLNIFCGEKRVKC